MRAISYVLKPLSFIVSCTPRVDAPQYVVYTTVKYTFISCKEAGRAGRCWALLKKKRRGIHLEGEKCRANTQRCNQGQSLPWDIGCSSFSSLLLCVYRCARMSNSETASHISRGGIYGRRAFTHTPKCAFFLSCSGVVSWHQLIILIMLHKRTFFPLFMYSLFWKDCLACLRFFRSFFVLDAFHVRIYFYRFYFPYSVLIGE